MTNRGAGSEGVERSIQKFLEALAAGGGKRMEQMTPSEARAVLIGAQSSVPVDLPKADVSLRTITSEGQTVSTGAACSSGTVWQSSCPAQRRPCAWPLEGQLEEGGMAWGLPPGAFTFVHVVLSLIGIGSGLVMMYALLRGWEPGWPSASTSSSASSRRS